MNRKKILLTLLMTVLTLTSFSQETLGELMLTTKQANYELDFIYDLDVFGYFNLEGYDTDLKKNAFKKSPEYLEYLAELKIKREEMLKSTYFVKQEEEFRDINYDVKRQGFELELGMNFGRGTMSARAPKSIYFNAGGRILLKALPSKLVPSSMLGKGVWVEKLFLPISEEMGLEIENNKSKVDIYYFFTPIGREKSTFKYYNSDGVWYNITRENLKSNYVRIMIVNNETEEIYFDKKYTYTKMVPILQTEYSYC